MWNIFKLSSDFWQGEASLRRMDIYQRGVGILLTLRSMWWVPYAPELFSSKGFHLGLFSQIAPTPVGAYFFCGVLCVSSACIAVGYRSRIATIAVCSLLFYLQGINGVNGPVGNVADIVVLLILALRGRPCSGGDKKSSAQSTTASTRELTGPLFSLRLLQIYFAQIYFVSGVMKALHWMSRTYSSTYLFCGRWATPAGVAFQTVVPADIGNAIITVIIFFEIILSVFLLSNKPKKNMILLGCIIHGVQVLLLSSYYINIFTGWALVILFCDEKTIEKIEKVLERMHENMRAQLVRTQILIK